MTGKEAIIAKIISDAQRKANSTLEEGNKRALEIISVAQNDARIYKDKNMAESYAERDEIVRRKITVANLEVKKNILMVKKTILDKAFDEALVEIKKDKVGYLGLISRMLKFAEDGEVVTIAESDKEVVTKEWVIATVGSYGKKVSVNDTYGSFCGGIIISGGGSDKNLTLEVELSTVRDEYEPQIADVLFGE